MLADTQVAEQAGRLLAAAPPDLEAQMAELGWLMLPFDQADGGLADEAGDSTDLLSLFCSFGVEMVAPQTLFQAMLGGGLIAAATDWPDRAATLEAIMAGTMRVATALYEANSVRGLGTPTAMAVESADGWTIDGTKTMAIGARDAAMIIVLAATGTDIGLFAVPRDTPGLSISAYRLRDGQTAGDVVLDGVTLPKAALLLRGDAADAALDESQGRLDRALAAEAAGIAHRCLERTLTYTRDRSQFGRTIASFQVVQHRLAEMQIATDQAEAMAAVLAAGQSNGATGALTPVAELAFAVAKEAIQLHGGVGMTEDLPLGRGLRRLMTLLLLS